MVCRFMGEFGSVISAALLLDWELNNGDVSEMAKVKGLWFGSSKAVYTYFQGRSTCM